MPSNQSNVPGMPRELDLKNSLFLVLSPLAAIILGFLYFRERGLGWAEMAPFWIMTWGTGLAITAGYHRYYSHRTHECHRLVQFFYIFFGAAALENSVLYWASDHRFHHRYVDTDLDPYDIMKGFFWAHMGWIFFKDRPDRNFDSVPDLKNDPLVIWQNRYYLPLMLFACFGLPTLIGWSLGNAWGGFLWGGLVRVVMVQHATYLINSAAHYFGTRPYSIKDSSRDNWILAFFTFGEGYHNYHHTFQGDYRNGIAWYHWDPAKWVLTVLSHFGLAWRLNRTPEWSIVKARMDVELQKIQPLLDCRPETEKISLRQRIESSRRVLETAMIDFARSKRRYSEWLNETRQKAREEIEHLKEEWEADLKDFRAAALKAKSNYMGILQDIRRQSALSA